MQETLTPHVATISATNGFAAEPHALAQALQVTQQSLAAFQQLQEQTAQLHRQFLENQEASQRTLQMLVEQQHALLVGGAERTVAAPVARTAPAAIAPPIRTPPPTAVPVNRNGNAGSNGEYRAPIAPPPAPIIAKQVPPKPQYDVASVLLAVVAEKTGYPAEMLTPEMALDADLGIDSIKRVEIFSALQERLPQAPLVKPEHLGSLQTLRDVIEFLSSNVSRSLETHEGSAPTIARVSKQSGQISSTLMQVVAEKTGYPAEMLNAEMALDADLGIDSIKRVEIFSALQERLPDAPIVKPEHLGSLQSLGDVIAFLSGGDNFKAAGTTAKKA